MSSPTLEREEGGPVDTTDPMARPHEDELTTSTWRKVLRYVGLPLALVVVVAATLYYVTTADLDSIESRLLDTDRSGSERLR